MTVLIVNAFPKVPVEDKVGDIPSKDHHHLGPEINI